MNAASWRRHGVWVFLLVYAVVFQLLVSYDSFLRCGAVQRDSIWFFTCGKAWMNGMTPYVDFADSKGPLLWLFYGIGYLLSPRNTAGVWLLICARMAIVYLLLYRTARLFLASRRRAALAVVLTNLAFYFLYMHTDAKAEHLNLPFMAWSLYYACRLLYARDLNCLGHASVVVGVSVAATLLIKYNGTLMLLPFAVVVWSMAWRDGRLVRSLLHMVAGAAAVLVPMLVYMACNGWLEAFFREYFLITPLTLANARAMGLRTLPRMYLGRYTIVPYGMLLAAAVVGFGLCHKHLAAVRRWFPLAGAAWFIAVGAVHGVDFHYYYPSTIFAIFGTIAVMQKWPRRLSWPRWWGAVAAVTLMVTAMNWACCTDNLFFRHLPMRDVMYRYAWMMHSAGVEKPRVIYYQNIKCIDFGQSLEALPGCKYWIMQVGATPEMRADQRNAVEQGRADFVFALDNEANRALFDSLGYTRHSDVRLNLDMYTKHPVQEPPATFRVTPLDILLKRVRFNSSD